MGMTAVERIQQIRAFEDQNGSFQEHSSGHNTGVRQVEKPLARDPNNWSWKRAGTGSPRQGHQGIRATDLCDEVVLLQVGTVISNVDVAHDTIQFRGIEVTTVGEKRRTGGDLSGVDITHDTIDYEIDRTGNNVNDDSEDDIISLENGDIIYLYPDSTVIEPGDGALPGGVNSLAGANGRYFVSTRGVFPQAHHTANRSNGSSEMRLHDSQAGAMAKDIDDATGAQTSGIFATSYPHLLATGSIIRVNPAPGSDNGVVLLYVDDCTGYHDAHATTAKRNRLEKVGHGLETGHVVRVNPAGNDNGVKLSFCDNSEVLNTASTYRHIRRLTKGGDGRTCTGAIGGLYTIIGAGGHGGLITGDIVRTNQDLTPASESQNLVTPPLVDGTDYYVNIKSGSAFTLHANAADAAADANVVAITAGGIVDFVTKDDHNLATGDLLHINPNPSGGILTRDNTVLPNLATNIDYYMNRVSASEFTLHLTPADGAAGSNPVLVTGPAPPVAGLADLVQRLDPARDYYVRWISDDLFTINLTATDAATPGNEITFVETNGDVDFVRVLGGGVDYHVNVINATTFTIHPSAVEAAAVPPVNPFVPAVGGSGIVDFIPASDTVDLRAGAAYGFGVYKSLENGDAVFLSGPTPEGLTPTSMNGSWQITGPVTEYFVSVTHSLTGPPTMAFHAIRDDAIASPPVNRIDLTTPGGAAFKVWDYMNEGEYKTQMGASEKFGDYWINPEIFLMPTAQQTAANPFWGNSKWPPDVPCCTGNSKRHFWRNYPINHPLYPGQVVRQVWEANLAVPPVPAGWWRDDTTWYFRDPNIQNTQVANHPWVNTRELNDNQMHAASNPFGITIGTGTVVPGIASRYWVRQPLTKEFEKYRDADPSMTKLYYWKYYENALPR
uniref:Uncharacterized protein n=1 Tax=uncultured verrucomicrobium HF0500_16O23 TaxID=723598 RepID=E7C572_9BACT|nr:hypothetical protein [uncultured verrucomicrobium HF0500_16O23]